MSDSFAAFAEKSHPGDTAKQVGVIHRRAYGRELRAEETDRATAFVGRHGLAAYCRAIFNSNEFLYID